MRYYERIDRNPKTTSGGACLVADLDVDPSQALEPGPGMAERGAQLAQALLGGRTEILEERGHLLGMERARQAVPGLAVE